MIYIETLPLLYKANTFTFLHNEVLKDFCSLTLPYHLSSIRSVHLHFRFRQTQENFIPGTYRDQFPPPWDEYTYERIIKDLVRQLPNLTSLSLFLQGPLLGEFPWMFVFESLYTIKEQFKDLRFMVVRLPRSAPGVKYVLRGCDKVEQAVDRDQSLIYIEPGIRVARVGEHGDQPELGDGQPKHEMADCDTGREPGWKIGTMYVPDGRQEGAVGHRHYAVRVEDEVQVRERW